MEKITQEEWDEKLVLHEMLLDRKKGGKRLILRGYDLSEIVFKENINLKFAILNKCNLKGINLYRANLEEAYLQEANLEEANLEYANLEEANLKETYLEDANLEYANLYKAYLYKANLEEADLYKANLEETYLEDANLKGANLEEASLYEATGNNKEIKTYELGGYTVNYTSKVIQIGCKNHTIEEWFQFSDEEIDKMSLMDDDALKWWNEYKNDLKIILKKDSAVDSDNYWWEQVP